MQRLEMHACKHVIRVRFLRKTKYEVLFDEVCVQNQWGVTNFYFAVLAKESENSMLLLPQSWLQWYHFVLGFPQKSVGVGRRQNSISVPPWMVESQYVGGKGEIVLNVRCVKSGSMVRLRPWNLWLQGNFEGIWSVRTYNLVPNILELCNVLIQTRLTTSEMKRDT